MEERLWRLDAANPECLALDGEVSTSCKTNTVKQRVLPMTHILGYNKKQ